MVKFASTNFWAWTPEFALLKLFHSSARQLSTHSHELPTGTQIRNGVLFSFFLLLKRKVLFDERSEKEGKKKKKKGKIPLEVSISSYSRKGECIIPLFSLIQDWGELVRVGFDRKQDKRTDLTALNIETTDSSSSKQFMGESVFTLDSKIYKDFLKVIFIFLPKGFYN